MTQTENKQKVREFYDEIGWSKESTGFYQNARYEDLRPVSAEYIHKSSGRFPKGKRDQWYSDIHSSCSSPLFSIR